MSEQHWTLDKRVPIALLLGLVASTLSVGGTALIAHHRWARLRRTSAKSKAGLSATR